MNNKLVHLIGSFQLLSLPTSGLVDMVLHEHTGTIRLAETRKHQLATPALLEASEATDGLRGVLAGRRVERIGPDDPTVRIDLDTPEAYEAARAELGALPGSTCGGRGRS